MIDTLPSQRLAPLIRTLRKAQGLSQEALAERAGLHRNFVSLIERGKNQPTVDTLFRLAEALGVTAVELVERISTANDPA
ncbi:helix-turn-helix domain-containing protein [Aromatoleum aromaticum]|uniref:helix-turn-helix domain-containing protein n=1 Tax=Aromatoleum aromaticum TaxID=551760 RepID=UPI001459A16A|nr:helix-turn-helix transcriptional regulator [Aromatoleum aromaticum]NMG56027.1 helix-turn-helix domain-containing protein [Aromatoleum aromaticum]